jgi:hypothetical protein
LVSPPLALRPRRAERAARPELAVAVAVALAPRASQIKQSEGA